MKSAQEQVGSAVLGLSVFRKTHVNAMAQGGKCGSTYVDRNLHKFLDERFGHAFRDVPDKFKGPGSRFMTEFEKVKHSFGGVDNDSYEISPIPLGSGHDSEHFDEDEEAVILSQ